MAGRLLFVVLMCFFHEIQTQVLPPPTLTVNPPVIKNTDSVTMKCQTPSSVSLSQCYFYTIEGKFFGTTSCLQTVTGTELLLMSDQRSPAEVKVKCLYIVMNEGKNIASLYSDMSTITINSPKPQMNVQHFTGDKVIFTCSLPGSANEDTRCNLYFGETSRSVQTITTSKTRTSTEQQICQFYFPIDDFLRRLCSVEQKDASCDYSLGSEHKSLSPRSDRYSLTDIVKKESSFSCVKSTVTTTKDIKSSTTQTMLTFFTTKGLTVIRTRAFTTEAPLKSASDFVEKESDMTQTTVTTGGPVTAAGSLTSTESQTTLMFPTTREKESDMTQTTVTTGLTVIRTHASTPVTPTTASKTEISIWTLVAAVGTTVGVISLGLILLCTKRRSDVDELMCMNNLNHGGLLPAGSDEAYSVITSVAGAGLTGFEKLNRRDPQNEDCDVYHVYSTITEDPAASAVKDMVYSTLQPF